MAYGKASSWSSGKKKRSNSQKSVAEGAEELPGDAFDDPDAEEPPLAQPARRQSRGEPSRKSRRGEPEPWKPTPHGPPAAKPKQVPAANLSPTSLEKRHKRDRGYTHKASVKRAAAAAAEAIDNGGEAVSVYATTKGGKPRTSKLAERCAKSYAIGKVAAAVESVGGGDREHAQVLEDALKSKRLRGATAHIEGYVGTEAVQVALYHQEQLRRMLGRAAQTLKQWGRADDDRRGFQEAVCVALAASPQKSSPRGLVPSLATRARALSGEFGLSERTAERLLKAAATK